MHFKRILAIILVMALSVGTLINMNPQVAYAETGATTYYVDTNGDDNNDGASPNTAWRTLDKVNATTFYPGDTILFKSGCVWFGELHPLGSGNSLAQITIDKYGSDLKPVINGSGYEQAVLLYGQEYWTIQNLEIINDCTFPYMSDDTEPKPDEPSDTSLVHSGTKALKLTAENSWRNTCTRSVVSIEPNTNYTFSIWIKGSGSITLRGTKNTWSSHFADKSFTATSSWTKVSISFNSGSETLVWPCIVDSAPSGSIIYLDDASFTKDGTAIELLDDPGFEKEGAGWSIPYVFSIVTEAPAVVEPVESNVRSGSNSIQLVSSGGWDNIYTKSNITVDPDTNYTYSAWIKGSGKLQLVAYEMNSGSWAPIWATGVAVFDASADWAQVSATINTKTYSSLKLVLKEYGGTGTMYIDDVSFKKADLSGSELCPDTGFEKSGWDLSPGKAKFTLITETGTNETSEVRTGAKSLKLDGTRNWAEAYASGMTTVKPNTKYTYSAYIQGTGSVVLFAAGGSTFGSTVSGSYKEFTASTEWQQVSVTFNSGSYEAVCLKFQDSGGKIYIDDASFKEVDGDGSELCNDPSFENNGWIASGVFSIYAMEILNDNIRSGERALKLEATGGFATAEPLYSIAVDKNTDYSFSAWVKGSGSVMLRVYDESSGSILKEQSFSAGSSWTKVSILANSGDYGKVFACFVDDGPSGAIYIDDASFIRSGSQTELILDGGFERSGWKINYPYSIISSSSGENVERQRKGIAVIGENGKGAHHNIIFRNLDIHDVIGESLRDNQWWSASIMVTTKDPAESGATLPLAYFDGVLIEDCYIYDVTTYGIYSNMEHRGSPVTRNKNFIVRNVVVKNTGVDAICLGFCDNPIVEYCAAYDVAQNSEWCSWIGGIWTYACDGSTTQYCEVANTKYSGDSTAFDLDVGDIGTHLIQYNYSHDNAGGFILLFGDAKPSAAIIRYNISQNDHTNTFNRASIKINHNNSYFYNNVFYSGGTGEYDGVAFSNIGAGITSYFENNIFYSLKSVNYPSAINFDSNLYFGHDASSANDPNGVYADPMFVDPGMAGTAIQSPGTWEDIKDGLIKTCAGYQLQDASPAINMGKQIGMDEILTKLPLANEAIVSTNMGYDFFGNQLTDGRIDIGAYESTNGTVVLRPETPVLALDNVDRTIIRISNIDVYDTDTYGALEYTIDTGADAEWVIYDSNTGITGLLAAKEYTVKVRYSGNEVYPASPASVSASITTGKTGGDNSLPVTITEVSPNNSDITYSGKWFGLGSSEPPYTYEDGSYFEFAFTGYGIDILSEINDLVALQGIVDIYIDGIKVAEGLDTTAFYNGDRKSIYANFDLEQGEHILKVVKTGGFYLNLKSLIIYSEVIPVAPLLDLNESIRNAAFIVNMTDYADTAVYGPLQYSVNNGEWINYSEEGITGLVKGRTYTIRVRYAGLGKYVSSSASPETVITVEEKNFGDMYPAGWVKLNDTDFSINYVGTGWVYVTNRVWTENGGQEEYLKDSHATNKNGDYFEVSFTGTAIDYISQKTYDQGDTDIYIDGVLIDQINTYRSTRNCQQLIYRISDLEYGDHVLKVVKTGANWMLCDAVIVYGEEIIPDMPELQEYNEETVFILNTDAYLTDVYGPLEYSLNGSEWYEYSSVNGITGLVAGETYNVAVRYAGKAGVNEIRADYHENPSFHYSRPSYEGTITMSRETAEYRVSFIINYPEGVNPAGVTISEGQSVELPYVSREGYTFEGWYDAATDGNYIGAVGDLFAPISDITLYAYWKQEEIPDNTIVITGSSNGNGQANVYFDIRSANGKGYSAYLSETGAEGTFAEYSNVNYNSKGAHIKGLTNGKTYYLIIRYSNNGAMYESAIVTLNPNK